MLNPATIPAATPDALGDADLTRRDFWHAFAPQLHIAERSFYQNIAAIDVTAAELRGERELLRAEGYFQGSADWNLDMGGMAATVRALSDADISPVFAFLYDEFWLPFSKLHLLYRDILGANYRLLPDFWVWNIDPSRNEAGWKPHRDRGASALLPDGLPKSLTTWIPLSRATPLSSCMYIVPASLDPTYGTDAEDQWKFDYPSIRALPGGPGDFFMWNQAVLHWGSQSSPRAPEPRISMAFEFQRTDVAPFNTPLIPPLTILPFEFRLKLIAQQVLQYRHMYKVDPRIETMALKLLG
jgi:hypothetical protein